MGPPCTELNLRLRDSFDLHRSPSSASAFLPPPANAKSCMSAAAKRWKYLRRLVHFRQMDFEFAFWQMFYLVSTYFSSMRLKLP